MMDMMLTEPFITGENIFCASAKFGNKVPKCNIEAIKPSGDRMAKLIKTVS